MALTLRKIAQDMPGPPLALPPGWWPELEAGGAATAAALAALAAEGRLTLHGALSALTEPPAGAG